MTEPILDADGLDALPVGKSVEDMYHDILTKHDDGLWHSYETAPMPSRAVAKWAPRLVRESRAVAHEHITFTWIGLHLSACGRCFAVVHEEDCEGHARYHGDIVSWDLVTVEGDTVAYGAL